MGEEETGHHFADHAFKEGEYVSVRDVDGELTTLKVAAVAKF